MEVGVRDLRGELSKWLDLVRQGEEIVITERGRPVARLIGVSRSRRLDRLVAAGEAQMPTASRRSSARIRRVKANGSVAELVRQQRR